jgi:hypothetical protein
MGKRKVTILEPAATSVAEVAWFIESLGLKEIVICDFVPAKLLK